MSLDEKARIAAAARYQHPKSFCTCGHLGDGLASDHSEFGHGSCGHHPCPCTKFTWARWTPEFERYLKSFEPPRARTGRIETYLDENTFKEFEDYRLRLGLSKRGSVRAAIEFVLNHPQMFEDDLAAGKDAK